MNSQLANLPSYLNIKTTDSSIEFHPRTSIDQQVLDEAKRIYGLKSIYKIYFTDFTYTIEGGRSQQDRISALLFILQKINIINQNEKPNIISQRSFGGVKIEKNTPKSALTISIQTKQPEMKYPTENPNTKLGDFQKRLRKSNDDDDDDSNFDDNTRNKRQNVAYNSFNITTPYQKQNKSTSTFKPGGRTQIKKFSSDNQNTGYRKYVPPVGRRDAFSRSHDDDDDIKEDERKTDFRKDHKNSYNHKYTPPGGRRDAFSRSHDDDDDIKEDERKTDFKKDYKNTYNQKYTPPGGRRNVFSPMFNDDEYDDYDDLQEDERKTGFRKDYKNTYNSKYTPPRGGRRDAFSHFHNDNNDDLKEDEKNTSFNMRKNQKYQKDNSDSDDAELDVENDSNANKKFTKGAYRFSINKYNEKNESYERKGPFSFTRSKPQFSKDKQIESVDDALEELRWKQNPNIRKLDDKMYNELEKFDRIVYFMVNSRLNKEESVRLFIEICKTFSVQQLRESTNQMKKSSIYSIFFDNKKFKLSDHFSEVIIEIIRGTIKYRELNSIFEFFRTLISISSKNAEMLNKDITLLREISYKSHEISEQVEELINYVEARKQDEINSLESSVSPTPQDLFFANQTIDNHKGKVWKSFIDYKRSLIAITKENFYLPCRTNLNKLREGTLDARDLFLYENVKINFSTNIEEFKSFKDCNLFLQFQIRIPPNWKKGIQKPDWRYSERLANRALLILSTDPNLIKFDAVCKSCAAARGDNEISQATIRLLNKGIVPVTLISGEIKDNKTYYMFEPTSSWSSVQPILQRLTKMKEETFPKKFINMITKLDFKSNDEPETHKIPTEILLVENNVPEKIKFTYSFDANEEWIYDSWDDHKKGTELRVDHEQYKALRYALNHNLTLVNGAPGTGKTHLAREYLRIMDSIEDMKPIAIITFTNHALDSILEGVLDFVDPSHIIRWGGPMRSNNKQLQWRRWNNHYLEQHIQNQRDKIATEKQKLKNMYNIRQMVVVFIDRIKKYPDNIENYKTIIFFLNNFLKATETLNAKYPIGLTNEEVENYLEYQKSNKNGIEILSLPDRDDAINCWFYGKDYFERRNNNLRRVYIKNEEIYNTKYENQFNRLNEEEDDYESNGEESKLENNTNSEENSNKQNSNENVTKIHNNQFESLIDDNENEHDNDNEEKQKSKEEEEEDKEEEEKLDENMYGDLDMIEENKNSYLNSKISSELPRKYFDVLSDNFTQLINSDKGPSKSMIEFLQNIYSPITEWINKKEEYISKEEVTFAENETLSAGKYLSRMKLIGMTSTVASCRKEALEKAEVEIVIVEEAGELTESMLSCILPKTMKRLFLIGDYQQLRPKVEHEMTFEPFNYDISLFEKLVRSAQEKKAECLFTLSIQRRMHPQICQLVRNVFYKSGNEKITDDESTNLLGIPYGMPHRVRFYLHDFEIQSTTSRSYSNVEEAKYCASLIPFFICRGYKPKDITIIALYKGQKYEIENQIDELFKKRNQKIDSMELFDSLGNAKSSRDFKVVVLDNFQGEENKIIIVSLTRSDKPGFIKNRNRALVTLSRAREMLVVLGNRKIFGKECQNELWKKISIEAEKLSPYSMSTDETPGIIVNQCQIHNNSHDDDDNVVLKTPEKIIKYRFSYCKKKCDYVLKCGHSCQLTCHCHFDPPEENEHDDYYCPFRCVKKCPNHHQCKGTCGNCTHHKCPDCREIVHHVFPCGHEADIQCYLETNKIAVCHAKCGKKLNRCDHTCDLICGHSGKCDCRVKLDAVCPNCNRAFKYFCGQKAECPRICNHVLPCGHKCTNKCIDCIKYGHITECNEQCNFVFACGHRCTHKCSEEFPEHQHFFCSKMIELPTKIGQDEKKEQVCSESIPYVLFKQRKCYICNKQWINSNSLKKCKCQCNKKCPECGKRCRALEGEKCAFFCRHSVDLCKVKEPPKDKGPIFFIHDNHFLFVDEAIEKVTTMFENMILGKGDTAVPIHRLTCPVDGCTRIEPFLLNSLLFESMNCAIEKTLLKIKECSATEINKKNSDINGSDKIYWYTCPQCSNLFYSIVNDPDNATIKCPHCGFQKGEMFE